MPKEKKVKKNDIKNDALDSEESAVAADESADEDIGSPTYEELVADLDKDYKVKLPNQVAIDLSDSFDT